MALMTVNNGQNSTVVFSSFVKSPKQKASCHQLDFSPPPLQNKYIIEIMVDALPVPKTLEAQLSKCKAMREPTHYKSREKTPAVRYAVCKSPPS
jgi:hypothetical protein